MRPLPLALAALLAAAPAFAQEEVGARATGNIVDRAGETIGSISAFETPTEIVRIVIQAVGIPPGTHGIHLHETGVCEGDFSSAGGHIADDRQHGLVEGGPHPGDMPNAYVGGDGELSVEVWNHRISVEDHLLDEDGAAFIVHSGPDDYESQPAGDAGDRIACAVLDDVPAAQEN